MSKKIYQLNIYNFEGEDYIVVGNGVYKNNKKGRLVQYGKRLKSNYKEGIKEIIIERRKGREVIVIDRNLGRIIEINKIKS